jgi:molybdate transport system ATP-binding protein
MSILVEIKKQYKDYTLRIAFEGNGEPLGVLGASGCGKSMTLKCIAGIITPDEGRIVLNDRILFDSKRGINLLPQKRNIGLLFQNYALFPNMTVRENIGIGIRNQSGKMKTIDNLLSAFRLAALQNRYPGQLSGGEQQRVALARMLAYEPELLLLDEPFSALDSYLKEELQQELKEILDSYGKDIIMVSHSKDELYRFCNTIAVIDQGRLLEYGNKSEIFGKPKYSMTARLFGCSNISRAVKVSEYEVEAIDWKLFFQTETKVAEDIRFVGIRSEHIIPYQKGCDKPIPVSLSQLIEGPQEMELLFRNRTNQADNNVLHWKIQRSEWLRSGGKLPDYLCFPREHLLLLK